MEFVIPLRRDLHQARSNPAGLTMPGRLGRAGQLPVAFEGQGRSSVARAVAVQVLSPGMGTASVYVVVGWYR
jgi:hypothetical protein